MLPSTQHNLLRGRYLLFLVGLFVACLVVGMMVLGSLALTETSLRWWRAAVIALCWIAAFLVAQLAVRRGKPRWLFKSPR